MEFIRTDAGARIVDALVGEAVMAPVRALIARVSDSGAPTLVSANAYERGGLNAIPAALAKLLGERLAFPFRTSVVQANIVSHTGADGYGRLARQARFDGDVDKDCEYVMVDDFIGQGGTLANLRGWIEKRGGNVVGAVALTGKPYSAKLSPSREQLRELRERHGPDFEKWWREHFGHTFDCLTQSECRYLARSPDVDTIRNRLAEAQQGGNGPAGARSPREQKRHIADLNVRLHDRFPDGPPAAPLRPVPAGWQGYDRPPEDDSTDTRHSVFDPRVSKSLTDSEPPRRRCVRAARRSASVVKPWVGKSNQIAMTSSVRWSTPIRPRRRFFHVSLCYRRGCIGDIARRRVPIGNRTPRGARRRPTRGVM